LKRRLGLFATSEIIFLKSMGAQLLPPLDPILLTSFSDKSGKKKIDSWIRKEVHDFNAAYPSKLVLDPIFATSDLANGLAAFSEEINTCVFSKNAYTRFFIRLINDDTSSLTEFLVNLAITFEKISLKIYLNGKDLSKTYFLEGIWAGKTPNQWTNGTLYVSEIEFNE
jgi:hypothetical protein